MKDEGKIPGWQLQVLRYSSFILFIASIIYSLSFFVNDPTLIDFIPGTLALISSTGTFLLLKARHTRVAGYYFAISLWIAISVAFTWAGGLFNPLFMLLILTIVLSGVLLEPRGILLMILLNCITSGYFFIREILNPSQLQLNSYYNPYTLIAAHIPVYIMIGVVMYHLNTTILQQYDIIHQEQKLTKESEERYKMLLQQAGDPIIISNIDERILFANQATSKLLHYTIDELHSMYMTDIVDNTTKGIDANITTLSQFETLIIERELIRSDGTKIFVEANIKLFPNKTIQGIFRDIQDRKIRERLQLIELEKNSQNQKMQAIGMMAGSIAHDFNNTLGAIYGYIDLAQMIKSDPDRLETTLEDIRKAAEKGSNFVKDLLKIAKRHKVETEVLDLNHELTEMHSFIDRLTKESVALTYDLSPQSLPIKINLNHLNQIIINMIVNASEAIDEHGQIKISTQQLSGENLNEMYHVSVDPNSLWASIMIEDTGKGIANEELKYVFDPYFSTKTDGTGLGLSTVYGIVQQNNGHLLVQSEIDKGSIFTILFPYISSASERELDTGSDIIVQPEIGNGQSISVLIVDDNEMLLSTLVKMFKNANYLVYSADDGKQGYNFVKNNPSVDIDLIITDVKMPKLNGDEMIQQISELRPDIKVIFMSGYPSSEVFSNYQTELIFQPIFIQKPFDFHKINRLVLNMF